MPASRTARLIATILGAVIASQPLAIARQPHDQPPPLPLDAAPTAHPLLVTLTPYAWLTSYSGTIGARGIEADIDKSFIDVLEDTDSIFGLMGAIDVSYRRLVFQFNAAYAEATIDNERGRARSGPLGGGTSVRTSLDAELSNIWLEAMGGYRLIEPSHTSESSRAPALTLDAFAGVRYTAIDIDLDATADADITLPGGQTLTAGSRRSLSRDQEWLEPFIGLRSSIELSTHWSIVLRGDIGGFAVDGTDFAWQTIAAVGYTKSFRSWDLSFLAGYRALGQDHESSDFVWDVVTHGPLLGISAALRF